MLTLLKNVECYCPKFSGKNDILLAGDKICKIVQAGSAFDKNIIEQIYDCNGLLAFPGLIDQHVHIIGGGGEQGFSSRVEEIDIREILLAGVTTVVGLLGADSSTRSLRTLFAKAKALETQGITTYIYTGSYCVPAVTLTESVTDDLVLIDNIIGVGEIAISDHRSSQPTLQELRRLASQTHIGGLIGGKAGVLHFHTGSGRAGLVPLFDLVDQTDLPMDMFIPSHINRSPEVFSQGIRYWKKGGYIDITAGETTGVSMPGAVRLLLQQQKELLRVTVSSDANGSIPGDGIGSIYSLYKDIQTCIKEFHIHPEIIFRLVTENVAKVLKLYPIKGALSEGSDADILITDKDYNIQKVICMGKLLVDNGKVIERQTGDR
ncbi:MAG: beta-aspartyl-peptidase [Clostridiales bacterium]|nr:beta-aspartyl-peptidase [Clostridiales bacterium]